MLEATVSLWPGLEEKLERVVSGETFAAADLPEPSEGERKPPERKEEGAQRNLFGKRVEIQGSRFTTVSLSHA